MKTLGRAYRHLKRYREVVSVLLAYGLDDLVAALGAEHYLELGLHKLKPTSRELPHSRPERLRRALEELGPTFVKGGQYLSTRLDLLPPEYAAELAKLQDRVPPFPYVQVRELVQAELKAPLKRLFRSFDAKPLAAASVAQTHAAVLAGGEEVVVKVQRPGLRAVAEADLEILAHLAGLMERHLEDWRWRRPGELVAQLRRTLEAELDFSLEAAHMERLARNFEGSPGLRVPRVCHELSAERVLTMERIRGVKAGDRGAVARLGLDPSEAALRINEAMMLQVFEHGFFHADPHPGNVFVLPAGEICFVDFGMMGRLDRPDREAFTALMAAVVGRDEAALAEAVLLLAEADGEPDRRGLEAELGELLDRNAWRPLREVHVGRLLQRLFQVSSEHKLRFQPELLLAVKALTQLESLTRALDPDFDLARRAEPLLRELQRRRLAPGRLWDGLRGGGRQALAAAAELPQELRGLLRQARKGVLKVEFEHRGLEPALSALDRVSNRLAFAVVLGSLLVGSSLVLRESLPPLWHGFSLAGLGGYAAAACMALWLLWSILRHGRM